MSISPTLTRRILATILFLSSTFGVLMFLPFNPLLQGFSSGTSQIAVYALIFVLIFILALTLLGTALSQNIQFLITLRDSDERSQLIKKNVILKSFFGIFLILILWSFGHYLLTFGAFRWGGFGLLAKNVYWLNLSGYFVFVPILIFPFVVALWTDTEARLINPFLTIKSYLISSSKIILVSLIICLAFGGLAINDLLTKDPINSSINKSEIDLLGDANFEITIDPLLENGSIAIDSNNFNNAQMIILNSTTNSGIDSSYSFEQISGNNSGIEYKPINQSPAGSFLVNAGYQLPPTQAIFGTPTVQLRLKELNSLTLLNTKSVKITTVNGKCLDKDNLKLTLQGNIFGKLELPCNAQPKDFKNLADYRY